MNKHFIKPGFVAAVGLGMMFIFMTLEARGTPLSIAVEAQCYGAASTAKMYERAAQHRLTLRPNQEVHAQEISYWTGYAKGFIESGAALVRRPAVALATIWYNENCLEKTE